MSNDKIKENLKAAEAILKDIKIPGKKDSMLLAAKKEHNERVGELLKEILNRFTLPQSEVIQIVDEFKEKYKDAFLKFITEKKD